MSLAQIWLLSASLSGWALRLAWACSRMAFLRAMKSLAASALMGACGLLMARVAMTDILRAGPRADKPGGASHWLAPPGLHRTPVRGSSTDPAGQSQPEARARVRVAPSLALRAVTESPVSDNLTARV